MMFSFGLLSSNINVFIITLKPRLKPEPSPAQAVDQGLGPSSCEPKPSQAEPKPGLWGRGLRQALQITNHHLRSATSARASALTMVLKISTVDRGQKIKDRE
jgi:hypothetical protein